MRRTLIVTTLVLTVLLGAGAAQAKPADDAPSAPPAPVTAPRLPAAKAGAAAVVASTPPVFNNYLFCFGGYVYTDYTDPDGDDALLNVQVWVWRPSWGQWAATWLLNTGPSAHGVFFWLNGPDVYINTAEVAYYYFRAMDQTGTWSTWTVATGSADGSCRLQSAGGATVVGDGTCRPPRWR